jgi:hypothetical protein
MLPIIALRQLTWPKYAEVENADSRHRRRLPNEPTGDLDGEPPRAQNTSICTGS